MLLKCTQPLVSFFECDVSLTNLHDIMSLDTISGSYDRNVITKIYSSLVHKNYIRVLNFRVNCLRMAIHRTSSMELCKSVIK